MKGEKLSKKPLIEAVFELKWQLKQEGTNSIPIDPFYSIIFGKLYNKLKDDFPVYEQLPTAAISGVSRIVQHRFRKVKSGWPVIQFGAGVITVNDTDGYTWDSFRKLVESAVKTLFEIYPDYKEKLKIDALALRYVDAYNFDYKEKNISEFLREKMKFDLNINDKFFEENKISSKPLGVDLRSTYEVEKPKGLLDVRFARGRRKRTEDVLIWETGVYSEREDFDSLDLSEIDDIMKWTDDAHEVAEDWFFKLIEGDLEEEFK